MNECWDILTDKDASNEKKLSKEIVENFAHFYLRYCHIKIFLLKLKACLQTGKFQRKSETIFRYFTEFNRSESYFTFSEHYICLLEYRDEKDPMLVEALRFSKSP